MIRRGSIAARSILENRTITAYPFSFTAIQDYVAGEHLFVEVTTIECG